MPKRQLHKIAKDYDVDPLELREIAFNRLDDDMISGSRGLVWINEDGQALLDDILPQKHLRRGLVKGQCPNKNFVYVLDREAMQRIPVKIPDKLRAKLTGKLIHFIESEVNGQSLYEYIKV